MSVMHFKSRNTLLQCSILDDCAIFISEVIASHLTLMVGDTAGGFVEIINV